MTAPVAALSLIGTLTALAHLHLATFALGAWTFPLAFVGPGVITARQLLASRPLLPTLLLGLLALGANLVIEAFSAITQLVMLG